MTDAMTSDRVTKRRSLAQAEDLLFLAAEHIIATSPLVESKRLLSQVGDFLGIDFVGDLLRELEDEQAARNA